MTSNSSRFSNLRIRLIAALIGAFLIVLCVTWSQWSYFVCFLLISQLTILEFYKLLRLDDHLPLKSWGALTGLVIYCVIFFEQLYEIPASYYFIILPFTYAPFLIKLYKKEEGKPFTDLALTYLGIFYIAFPFSMLHISAFINDSYSWEIILGILFIQWGNDTGAYFTGSRFGRRKLFERISPKKSWEGLIGGFILGLAVSYAAFYFLDVLPLWRWIGIGIIISIAGTYGDLIESLFKRSIEIKDSGTSIPGHGGFLDRFDSLLISLPFIAFFLKIL